MTKPKVARKHLFNARSLLNWNKWVCLFYQYSLSLPETILFYTIKTWLHFEVWINFWDLNFEYLMDGLLKPLKQQIPGYSLSKYMYWFVLLITNIPALSQEGTKNPEVIVGMGVIVMTLKKTDAIIKTVFSLINLSLQVALWYVSCC